MGTLPPPGYYIATQPMPSSLRRPRPLIDRGSCRRTLLDKLGIHRQTVARAAIGFPVPFRPQRREGPAVGTSHTSTNLFARVAEGLSIEQAHEIGRGACGPVRKARSGVGRDGPDLALDLAKRRRAFPGQICRVLSYVRRARLLDLVSFVPVD
jgi:hypothetical protein